MWGAFFKRSSNRVQLSTVNRLSKARQSTKDSNLGVRVIANSAPSVVRVAAMTARAISPDCRNSLPVNQG
eukprot:717909-Amphidinium_carterae.1